MFIRCDSGFFLTMATLGLLMVSILGQNQGESISINTTLPNDPLLYANDEVRVRCNDGSFGDPPPNEFGLVFQGSSQNYRCVKSLDGFAQILPEASLIEPVRPANESDCRELVDRNSFEFVFKPHQAGLTYQCLMYDGTTIRRSRDETLPATVHELPTDTQLATDRENYYEESTVTATCNVTGGNPETTSYQYSFNGQTFNSPGAQVFEAKRNMTGGITQDIDCTSTEHLPYRDRSQPRLVASKTINIYWPPNYTQLETDGDKYYEGMNVTATCNVTGGNPETTSYQYSFGGQIFNSSGFSSWTFEASRTMTGDISCTSTEHLPYGDRSQPGLVGSKTINIYYIDLTPAAPGGVERELNPGYNNSVDCQDFLDTNLPTSDLSYSWTRDNNTVSNEATLYLPKNEANGTVVQYTCNITGPKFRDTDPDQTRRVVVNVTWSLNAAPPTTLSPPPLPSSSCTVNGISCGTIGGIIGGLAGFCVCVTVVSVVTYRKKRCKSKSSVKSGAEKTRGNLVEGVEETPLGGSSTTNQTENRRYPSNNGPNADLYTEVVKEKPAQPAQAKPEPLNYADLDHSGTPRTVASVQPRVRPSQNDSVTYTQVVLQKAPEGSTPAQSVEIEMVENDLYSSVEKPAPIKP